MQMVKDAKRLSAKKMKSQRNSMIIEKKRSALNVEISSIEKINDPIIKLQEVKPI